MRSWIFFWRHIKSTPYNNQKYDTIFFFSKELPHYKTAVKTEFATFFGANTDTCSIFRDKSIVNILSLILNMYFAKHVAVNDNVYTRKFKFNTIFRLSKTCIFKKMIM